MDLWNRFEQLLKERDMKVIDVSRIAHIRPGVFSDWKNGRYTPKLDKLQDIASALGVPITYFTDPEGYDMDVIILHPVAPVNPGAIFLRNKTRPPPKRRPKKGGYQTWENVIVY